MDNLPIKPIPIPSIRFIFPNGLYRTIPILWNCRGIRTAKDGQRPHAFKFIGCTPEVITEEFIDWYFTMVLPCLSTNAFMYQVSITTAPQELQSILKLPQGVEYVQ